MLEKIYQKIMSYKQSAAVILYLVEAIFVVGIIFFSLNLFSYDLQVPFSYSGDSIAMLIYIKGIILNGWTFDIPQLSAPYGMSAAAFPLATSTDWLIMKIISIFTSKPGLILNFFWIITLVLSAWTATISMRLMGIKYWLSFLGGLLFAFLPFALLRNVSHLNLVYYAVPLLSLLAIKIANPKEIDFKKDKWIIFYGYLGCLIQGFDYIYFSFFAVLMFIFATIMNRKSKVAIRVAIIASSIIVLSSVINLSPSMYSWHVNGKPSNMDYKQPVEAEVYGAKIRKMIVPNQNNPIQYLAKWGQLDAAAKFHDENENTTVRLGLYGALGLLLMFAISLRLIKVEGALLPILASFSLLTVLVITVGGLGAVFNLLISPDIRAYNRFSVFLGFFSILALSAWFQSKIFNKNRNNKYFALAIIFFACFSLYDQLLDGAGLIATQKIDETSANHEIFVVNELEKKYPETANVFMLPVTPFPPDPGLLRMSPYDNGRPFLWSSRLNWSWPSFSQRHKSWQDKMLTLEGDKLLEYLTFSKFDLIWVDRYGYKDNGVEITNSLIAAGAKEQLTGYSERYAIFETQDFKKEMISSMGEFEFEKKSQDILNGVVISWDKGFYDEEVNSVGTHFRWSNKESELILRNFSDKKSNVVLSFDLFSEHKGRVTVDAGSKQWSLKLKPVSVHHEINLEIYPATSLRINFKTNIKPVAAPNDTREMFFSISNVAASSKEENSN